MPQKLFYISGLGKLVQCVVCIAMTNYTNTYTYRIITTTQWRRVTQFLEKYTSHFIWKGCVWDGVGDRTELQHIDPHCYGHQRFFPVLLGYSTGGLEAQPLRDMFLNPASSLQLVWSPNSQSRAWGLPLLGAGFLYRILSQTDWISFALSYIIFHRPPSSCGCHNCTHSTCLRSRLYSDIPWADAPVIYTGTFPILTARPGRRSICNTMYVHILHFLCSCF